MPIQYKIGSVSRTRIEDIGRLPKDESGTKILALSLFIILLLSITIPYITHRMERSSLVPPVYTVAPPRILTERERGEEIIRQRALLQRRHEIPFYRNPNAIYSDRPVPTDVMDKRPLPQGFGNPDPAFR